MRGAPGGSPGYRNNERCGNVSGKFVPDDFVAPLAFKAPPFVLKKLSPEYARIDYEAVLRSAGHIRKRDGITDPERWPQAWLTYEKDFGDLAEHAREFEDREAFAYTVLSMEETVCLGCVYIDPPGNSEHDAVVRLWTDNDRDDLLLYRTVRRWVEGEWPFKHPSFPDFAET